ncbi:hypothetical protein LCGC14_2480010 [marine sediment metagenome]|uniref:Uncharacterized protein n=1 Tax=marine sediment metagenome TaxID=412755 RepID=A0A0F9BVL2_9ZZZZ
MNFRLKRFIETTLPMVVGYGMVITAITTLWGIHIGLLGIILFSIVDIVMLSPRDLVPKNIEYDGKYFSTLTELIEYVKTRNEVRK